MPAPDGRRDAGERAAALTRLRDFAEIASDWYWETDAALRFTYASAKLGEDKQFYRARFLGKTPWEFVGVDPERDENWAGLVATMRARAPFRNFRYGAKDGKGRMRYWRINGKPFADAAGRFAGFRGIGAEETAEVEAEVRAARAESRLAEAIEAITDGFALYDAQDRLVLCNGRYRELYDRIGALLRPGMTFEEILRLGVQHGQWPDAAGREGQWIAERLRAHRRPQQPVEQLLHDGRWLHINERRTRDGDIVGLRTDITEFKRAREMMQARAKVLERLAEGAPLAEILVLLALGAEQGLHGIVASILLLDNDGKRLRRGAAPSLPELFNQAVDGLEIGPEVGACGTAAFTGARVVVQDIETQPHWPLARELTRRLGLRACWSEPIVGSAGSVLGTLAFYCGEPRRPGPAELDMMKTTAHLAGIAIARAQADHALRQSEARFRDVAEVATDWIWETDAGQRLAFLSDRFAEVTGLDPDAVLGRTRWELALGEPEGGSWQGHRTDLVLKRPFRDFHYSVAGPDARPQHWLEAGKPVYDDAGNFIGYRGTGTNITDRVAAETLSARLGRIIEHSANEIYVFDAHSLRLLQVNQGARENLGYTAHELEALAIFDIQPELGREQFEAAVRPLREGKRQQVVLQVLHRRKDGSRYPVEARLQFMATERPAVFVAAVQDITERKRADDALRAAHEQADIANRAKTEFLANMSHELRTPLNAIIGFSEIMRYETFGPLGTPKYREYAAGILESGRYLLALISDILDVAKIEAGKFELFEEPVDLREVARSCLRLVEDKAKEAGIRLETRLARDLPPIVVDKRALKQILVNLLSNALKFTVKGGRVSLRARVAADNRLHVVIADNGIGIDPRDVPRLLAPFEQVAVAHTRRHEGTGLGLPLVKSLVELHGGTLLIKSAPGAGTTVTVTLPAERVRSGLAA